MQHRTIHKICYLCKIYAALSLNKIQMAHLSIQNIGPVKAIDIELNRVNVFMGPQSSGKSTIAKIISFCQWLEKDCLTRQSIGHIDENFTQERFVEYHNVSDYLNETSLFTYAGQALKIMYADSQLIVNRAADFKNAAISKNAYIPSERNVISIPGIFSTKMPENYLASFLDDWQNIRAKYRKNDKVSVLDLGESYYFDENSDTDMLMINNGHPLHLSQASSGLQSVVPLCVYISYLTDWIYCHEENRSSDARKRIRKAALVKALAIKNPILENSLDFVKMPGTKEPDPKLSERFDKFNETFNRAYDHGLHNFDEEFAEFSKQVFDMEKIMGHPKFSNIIIEEPEQNIFPLTQTSLVHAILAMINHDRDNLVITTHSPFILYALNNCMLAGKVGNEIPTELLEHISVPHEAWIDPHKVSVWELREGHIQPVDGQLNATIQDADGLIRGNYFDRVMKNVMADFNGLVNFLG